MDRENKRYYVQQVARKCAYYELAENSKRQAFLRLIKVDFMCLAVPMQIKTID